MGLEEGLLKVAHPPTGQCRAERQGTLPPRDQCGPRVLLKGQGSQTEEEMGQWSLELLKLPTGLRHSAPSGWTNKREKRAAQDLNTVPK